MKKLLAKKVIEKKQPTIVHFCGTWGKTMAMNTASTVLGGMGIQIHSKQGTCAETITSVSGYSNPFGFISLALKKEFKDVLFIENGEEVADAKELLSLSQNRTIVIPFISQYDLQQFGGAIKYLQKACFITKSIAKNTVIIFNKDVEGLEDAVNHYEWKKSMSFSAQTDQADFKSLNLDYKLADDAHITNDHRVQAMIFKIKNGGATLPIRIANAAGVQQIYPVLITMLLARTLDVNIVESLGSIKDTQALSGRMKLIPGIKKTLLLDDTYDIDAESAYTTFQVGSQLPIQEGKRRIAVVSDMLKHGKESEQAHCLLGDELASLNYDAIVAIGERAHDILRCAKDAGMDEGKLFHFMDQVDAGKFIQHEIKQGDLVVVKGAKEMKLESIIKELMAFPLKAKEEILNRM